MFVGGYIVVYLQNKKTKGNESRRFRVLFR